MSAKKEREKRRRERVEREARGEGEGRRRKLLQAASAAVFLAIVAVAVLIVVSQGDGGGGDASSIEGVAAVESTLRGIPQQGLLLGHPAAKVTLQEFGDLQCPFCKAFSEGAVPDVIESKVRTGEARIGFNNFVIIGDESKPAGAAAIAAGEQGRGWQFVELFYRNQGAENSGYVTDEFLTAIARGAGVKDLVRWNRERRSKRLLGQVEASTAEANRLGFEGTPSFAVEGPATSGTKPLGFVESAGDLGAAIDAAR